ncbi:MAG: hypothetical protein V2J14_06740 [Erythrobacter sp.]|jgi:hypothetical protein|nr:hypothetical protein [Erythrobacter sp.]
MMLDILEWYGAIAAVLAAGIVASNISDRVTGWAFVLFVSSSASLVAWGFLSDDANGIGWQNICLFVINGWGVYRYLLQDGEAQPDARKAAD